jgi:hypothetical protein
MVGRTGVVVGVIVVALAGFQLAGCSSDPNTNLPQLAGPRTVSANWSTADVESPVDMAVRETHYQLVGPHYSLGLAWVATGEALDDRDAGTLDINPVRAAQGDQLTVAAVDGSSTTAAFKPSGPIEVFAVVNGKTTLLRSLPLAATDYGAPAGNTQLIEISAPQSASVRLRVIDTNQTEELDLRTGSTSGTGYRQTQSDASWQGTATATLTTSNPRSSQAAELEVNSQLPTSTTNPGAVDHAELTNYQDGIGWAPTGTEFLTVPLPSLNVTCPGPTGFECLDYEDHFDNASALTFTPDGGAPIPARSEPQSITIGISALQNLDDAIIQVPAATTHGTVAFNLAGSQLVDDGTAEGTWTTAPRPFTLALSFS